MNMASERETVIILSEKYKKEGNSCNTEQADNLWFS